MRYTLSVEQQPTDSRPSALAEQPPSASASEPAELSPSTPAVADQKPWLWKAGQSGNPRGRVKGGVTVTDLLRQKADKKKLAAALLALAYKGDVTALRYVYDRLDGTPVQRTEDLTPQRLQEEAQRVALLLGTTPAEVLLQYEQLRLGPGA